jgi:hypothetical protein
MELFLMVGSISLFGLAITCMAFGAATEREAPPAQPAEKIPETVLVMPPAHFFADAATSPFPAYARVPLPSGQRVPLEALLLQIESHIRLEQAAAESFLEMPTAALLHGRTASPLIN